MLLGRIVVGLALVLIRSVALLIVVLRSVFVTVDAFLQRFTLAHFAAKVARAFQLHRNKYLHSSHQ